MDEHQEQTGMGRRNDDAVSRSEPAEDAEDVDDLLREYAALLGTFTCQVRDFVKELGAAVSVLEQSAQGADDAQAPEGQ